MSRDAKILDAAAELFGARGFAAVGVDAIGRTAGVTGPAIYRHFKGKDDILGALFDEGMDEITRVTAGTFEDPLQELRHVVRQHAMHVMNNRRLASVWLREQRSLSEAHRRRYRRRADHYINRWTELLQRCFPEAAEADYAVAAFSTIGALNSVDDWPHSLRTADRIDWLTETLVGGLRLRFQSLQRAGD